MLVHIIFFIHFDTSFSPSARLKCPERNQCPERNHCTDIEPVYSPRVSPLTFTWFFIHFDTSFSPSAKLKMSREMSPLTYSSLLLSSNNYNSSLHRLCTYYDSNTNVLVIGTWSLKEFLATATDSRYLHYQTHQFPHIRDSLLSIKNFCRSVQSLYFLPGTYCSSSRTEFSSVSDKKSILEKVTEDLRLHILFLRLTCRLWMKAMITKSLLAIKLTKKVLVLKTASFALSPITGSPWLFGTMA